MADVEAYERAEHIAQIISLLAGVAVTVYVLLDMTRSDPLGPQAQLARWWEDYQRRRRRQREEYLDVANFGLELSLYLERWVNRWAQESK